MKTILLKPTNRVIPVSEDTCFVLDLSETVNAHIKFTFDKSGINAKIIGAYIGTKDFASNLVVETIHNVDNTSCTTEVKGALYDEASSSFEGRIIIKKNAQQTASYLSHDVLVLGNNTRNESRPVLEIDANDVKASHGATTGRIDLMQMFYLKSRGMTDHQAKSLILSGFFNSLLSQVPMEDIRIKVANSLGLENV